MKQVDIAELQVQLLEILKWFDNYCHENGLKYYAVGGTMLGAARHNGFIPWDDDIDVAMPREDYVRLGELLQNKSGKYILETCNSANQDYCYPYAKVYDTTTLLVENYNPPLARGIFIDVFPLDGLGMYEKKGRKWFKMVSLGYKFYITRVGAIRKERSTTKNLAIIISRLIPQSVIDNRWLRMKLDKAASKYDYNNSTYIGNFFGNWGEKEIVSAEVIGRPTEYRFEDMIITGVEKYDKYLTSLYGDWRKLPPIEKRITHHDYLLIDLHKSYLSK